MSPSQKRDTGWRALADRLVTRQMKTPNSNRAPSRPMVLRRQLEPYIYPPLLNPIEHYSGVLFITEYGVYIIMPIENSPIPSVGGSKTHPQCKDLLFEKHVTILLNWFSIRTQKDNEQLGQQARRRHQHGDC
jgi:hypothetical protein